LGEAEKTRETRLTLNCQTFHGQRHLSSWKSFFSFFSGVLPKRLKIWNIMIKNDKRKQIDFQMNGNSQDQNIVSLKKKENVG
jgi:hypothetical protein